MNRMSAIWFECLSGVHYSISKMNNTLIALVPKVDNPTSMSNLRLISLCNTTYKIISKILVARLRPYMDDLVSPAQFVLSLVIKSQTISLLFRKC